MNIKLKNNGDQIEKLLEKTPVEWRLSFIKLLSRRYDLVTAKASKDFEKGYKSSICDLMLMISSREE